MGKSRERTQQLSVRKGKQGTTDEEEVPSAGGGREGKLARQSPQLKVYEGSEWAEKRNCWGTKQFLQRYWGSADRVQTRRWEKQC